MNWTPHITVACVLERDGCFLLVEEKISGQLVINQPAGHWEKGETLLEATIRETLEETAWRYQPTHVTGIYQWTQPTSRETFLRFCFTGDLLEHDPQLELNSGIERAIWLTQAELHQREPEHRSPLVEKCINDYINGQRFELSLFHFT